jgi:hypothetical protein
MLKGPRGEKRPADVIGAAVMVARIATGEIWSLFGSAATWTRARDVKRLRPIYRLMRASGYSRWLSVVWTIRAFALSFTIVADPYFHPQPLPFPDSGWALYLG